MSTYLNISDKIKLEAENPYLLENLGGAAIAYSLRLLDTSYTGNAITVTTNGSDSADIGFDGLGLDISSLETFANGGDAYVSVWYDQSGNGNNATQTSFSAMPKIVSNGSVILENKKPCILYDGINDKFNLTTGVTSTDWSLFSVLNRDPSFPYGGILNSSGPGFIYHSSYGYNFRTNTYNRLIINTDIGNSNHLIFSTVNSSTRNGYITDVDKYNYASVQNESLVNNGYTFTQAFGEVFSGFYKGTSQELIAYTSYKDGEQDLVMANGNKFYSIY